MPFEAIGEVESFEIRNHLKNDFRQEMIHDVREGMSRPQKSLPCKYFYDAYGSKLFERICCAPEYYLTHTELSILDRSGSEIMGFFDGDGGDLVELGSGANWKIRKLLDSLDDHALERLRYIPVDISDVSLKRASGELLELYGGLRIVGLVADFTRHLRMLPNRRKFIVFFGSTIGNFDRDEALTFLRNIRGIMSKEDRFLIGIDMVKSPEIIEAAYNDKGGLTERFNLNILANINRELNADFNLDDFSHLAFFDPEKERVEMHLEANRPVRVHIADLSLSVDLKRGETIHTENCQKFNTTSATRMFREAGLREKAWHTEPNGWFSLVELEKCHRG
jgi:L-histidine N-alpha-methyltransferase